MKTYGFGIIGCGMISDFHSAAISELEHGQLVAVSSRDAENAKRLTDRYNVDSYADYAEMLKRDDLDIVCICTPSGAHLENLLSLQRKPVNTSSLKNRWKSHYRGAIRLLKHATHRASGSVLSSIPVSLKVRNSLNPRLRAGGSAS